MLLILLINKSNISLDGFSIRGGNGIGSGGGISAFGGQNISINQCKIFDNSATYGGGANVWEATNVSFSNCIFLGNKAYSGGDAFSVKASSGSSNVGFFNCVVAGHIGNTIFAEAQNGQLLTHSYTNCTFANNNRTFYTNINVSSQMMFTLKNSIIYGNTNPNFLNVENGGTYNETITYSLVQGVTTGTGNLNGNTTNPQFILLPTPAVTPSTAGDFHLKDSSPCINAGTDVGVSPLDLDRNLRPQGGKTDMGAYESNINMNEIISKATGNWETTTTWNLERIPLSTDKVILNGHQVTVTTNAARAKDLEYKVGAILRYLAGGLLRFGL